MGGKVINGDDPNTRGNIARGILRGVLDVVPRFVQLRPDQLRRLRPVALQHARLLPRHRDDDGLHQRLRRRHLGARTPACAASPTRSRATASATSPTSAAATTPTSTTCSTSATPATPRCTASAPADTSYHVYNGHDNGDRLGRRGDFYGDYGVWGFTPTDAGFLPTTRDRAAPALDPRAAGATATTSPATARSTSRSSADSAHATSRPDDAARQRDQRRHRRDQEQRRFYTPLAGTLSDRAATTSSGGSRRRSRRPASATSWCSRPTATRPGGPDGNQYDPSQWQNTLDPRPASGPTARRSATSSTQLTALRTTHASSGRTLRHPDLRRRHGRHASRTRARSRRSTRWPSSAAATRPRSSAAAPTRCSARSRRSSATSRPRPAPPRRWR